MKRMVTFCIVVCLLLYLGKGIKAEEIATAKVEAGSTVTVKVTLKDYLDEPIKGAVVRLSCDDERVAVIPQKNPKNNKVPLSITDEGGAAFFKVQVLESGAITLLAFAQRAQKAVPFPKKLIQNALHIFIRPKEEKVVDNNIEDHAKLRLLIY